MLFELLEWPVTNMHLHAQCHLQVRQIKRFSYWVTDNFTGKKESSGFEQITFKYAQMLAT